MYYTIYQIINLTTDQIYIGKHKTKNLDDGYMGSGLLISRAIKKYGIENFRKEILFVFDSKEEMDAKEKELVNESFVNSNFTYNLALGGKGGWDPKKAKVAFLGKRHSTESKAKISKFVTENNPMHNEKTREKVSKSQKGKSRDYVSAALSGTKKSEEHRKRISEAIKKRWQDGKYAKRNNTR